jgi:hypothetical protein
MKQSSHSLFTALATAVALFATHAEEAVSTHLVETQLINPRAYPDDARRFVKPPSWELFGDQTHFTTLRGFQIRDGKLVNYAEDFERYTKTYDLGDVIWPNCKFLAATNIPDMVAEMKRRKLFLYQIWGYVPGSGSKGNWPQFRLSPGTSSLFDSQLGTHWLGMDMGEQDGRYVLGYASSMSGISSNRFAQYLNFHRYMEKIADDLGNRMAGLSAITFGPYFAKEGIFTILGAETAQGHPNAQIFYAFNRGAGKEYGLPWFGNSSVYNRWGYKSYGSEGKDHAPVKGTSLALMKRLLYSHLLYNCMIAGYEGGWFEGGWDEKGKLSPIGRLQQSAQKWVRANGQPGVMQTPIGVMMDFDAGWIFPSYNSVLYRVWGNLPYGPGDYLANNVFGLIYPGYQDSSFFHDETGFSTATPYGDSADVLLSDAPGWILARYPMLVVASELSGGVEVRNNLQAYIEQGGKLFITAGSLKNLPGGLAGITVGAGPASSFGIGQKVSFADGSQKEDINESRPFELLPLQFPKESHILAQADSAPAAVTIKSVKGEVTVFCSPFGLGSQSTLTTPVTRPTDQPLSNPYPMLDHVKALLDPALRSQVLFEAGDGLAVITCRRGTGDYTLGILNNSLSPLPFKIASHVGEIRSTEEIALDQSEKSAVGYLPEGFEKAAIGQSDSNTIAGGDIRIFRVRVMEAGVAELPHLAPSPAPKGCFLPLRGQTDIKEQLLARPTFFQHFDGVLVDWRYVLSRDKAELRQEAAWLTRQKVRLLVDLSSGLNRFPDLRLENNFAPEYQRSLNTIHDLIKKMEILGATDLLISLHNPSGDRSQGKDFDEYASVLGKICADARVQGITLHLRNSAGKLGTLDQLLSLVERIGAPNLKIAPHLGELLSGSSPSPQLAGRLKDRVGFWLASTPRMDVAGRVWTTDAPLAGSGYEEKCAAWLSVAPVAPVIPYAVHPTQDDEYRDALAIETITRSK